MKKFLIFLKVFALFVVVKSFYLIKENDLMQKYFVNLVHEQWETFKVTYDKKYESEVEDDFRMKIYMENMRKISKHNRNYENGLVSFSMKENRFTDLLNYEFAQIVNGLRHINELSISGEATTYLEPANVKIPDSVDWRKQGAVTEIKNQGECGSCWAFSATGSLEGQEFRKTNKLISLSEQNLMDCSRKFDNDGCEGGLMNNAFQYIKDNHGIDTEQSYPYEGVDNVCRYNPSNSAATDTGFVNIPGGDEIALQSAVATIGPISAAIDASFTSFQFYHNGIYYEPDCDSLVLDHGILVVGYDTYQKQDYWIVKNSWGTDWGEEGYIKMSRNRENNCGIATNASYPLV